VDMGDVDGSGRNSRGHGCQRSGDFLVRLAGDSGSDFGSYCLFHHAVASIEAIAVLN